jgi:type IV secretion system protein VirD4
LRPVVNLFFQQAIGLQTRELPEHDPALKHQVLMLLDEFTALGRIPIMAEAISYLPGYNVRVLLVIQTPAQLREVYGVHSAETMLKSLAARIVFAPKDYADAREISDELGFTTVRVKTVSKPAGPAFGDRQARGRSQSVSEQRRALLLPQEVKELGIDESLVLYEGLRPIRCRKIRYFRDRRFQARLMPPPSAPVFGMVPSGLPVARAGVRAASTAVNLAEVDLISHPLSKAVDTTPVMREATPEDVERLASLTRDDFEPDLLKLDLPKHDRTLSESELTTAVESFLDSLKSHEKRER